MSKKLPSLGNRRDFWNTPFNPVTGWLPSVVPSPFTNRRKTEDKVSNYLKRNLPYEE